MVLVLALPVPLVVVNAEVEGRVLVFVPAYQDSAPAVSAGREGSGAAHVQVAQASVRRWRGFMCFAGWAVLGVVVYHM